MTTKKEMKRDAAVGFYTTSALQKKLAVEAKAQGRSVSSHLHKILEARYEVTSK